ncbi:MAG: ComF family protein [Pseudomonadota bacterium]
MELQKVMDLLYPPQCVLCRDLVDHGGPLCAHCWADTPFITGPVCDACGTPLIGEEEAGGAQCDACLATPRPWHRGRAVLDYRDNGRRLVLGLKHGDRHDLVGHMAPWLARAAGDLITDDTLLVPIPLHWMRLLRRRFNQSAALANAVGRILSLEVCPDALIRTRTTPAQSGTADARYENVVGALRAHPKRGRILEGRDVLLVDDVMTSGATFTAATQACRAAGARQVSVLSLARVVKDP